VTWRRISILIVAALTARASTAAAVSFLDDGALPCRPTIACTADLVPPGTFELEVGYLFRKLPDPVVHHSIPFLTKLTLTEWLQLQIGGNGLTFINSPVATQFVDDLIVGFKFHWADQKRYEPSFSWSVALSLPLVDAPGYTRTYDLLTTIYFSKDFSRLHADLNLGVDLWRLEGPTRIQPWASLALSVGLGRGFTVMVENYYFADAGPIAPPDGGFLAALAFAPRKWIVIDAGGDIGYFPSQRVFSVFAGVTIAPIAFWRRTVH
jgi:hypothetical protein